MPLLARTLVAALLLASAAPATAGAATPFDVAPHFTDDVVVNTGDATQSPADVGATSYATTAAMAAATTEECRNGGPDGPLDIDGLPDNGLFALTDVHPAVQLGFAEGNNGSNVWRTSVDGENRTIEAPDQRYSRVVLLVASAQGESSIDVTLSYSDATSGSVLNIPVSDWFTDPAVGAYSLIDGMDRMDPAGTQCFDVDDGAIFGYPIEVNPTKTLTSINVEKDDASGSFLLLFGAIGEKPELTVDTAGLGTGAVVSGEATPFIDCDSDGGDCTQAWDPGEGTTVTLTATPDTGSVFLGWSGACTGTGQCEVTPDRERLATAHFGQPVELDVTREGEGSGVVTSAPDGIDCGSDCTQEYLADLGQEVELTATAASDSRFAGWSGDQCSGTSRTCVVTMDEAVSVTATFAKRPPPDADVPPGDESGDDSELLPGPPVLPPPSAGPDLTAPRLDVTLARRVPGARAARSGLPLSFTCSEACTLTVRVRLAGAAAKRLRLSRGRAVTVAKASATGAAGQAKTVRLRLTRRAARRLKRARRATLSVILTAVDAAGNQTVVRRTVTLRR
ncbi:MAG TPA: hypothetical protein VF587_04745 [Solirubrobacteraceae bacterium]|jgi:hypothetical protein